MRSVIVIVSGVLLSLNGMMTFSEDKSCGLDGDVKKRVEDCHKVLGKDASKEVVSDEGKFLWKLVVQTDSGKQIWRDETSGNIWSDVAVEKMNREKAIEFCQNFALGKEIKGHLPLSFDLPEVVDYFIQHEYGIKQKHGIGQVLTNFVRSGEKHTTFWTSTIVEEGVMKGVPLILLVFADKEHPGVDFDISISEIEDRHHVRCICYDR